MLEHIDQTGSFTLELAEAYQSKMIEYKKQYQTLPLKDKDFDDLLKYFLKYARSKN